MINTLIRFLVLGVCIFLACSFLSACENTMGECWAGPENCEAEKGPHNTLPSESQKVQSKTFDCRVTCWSGGQQVVRVKTDYCAQGSSSTIWKENGKTFENNGMCQIEEL